jgi:hypothetical protein
MKQADVKLGMLALTRVSGELVLVKVTDLIRPDGKACRYLCARTDNALTLPKWRTAAALRPAPASAGRTLNQELAARGFTTTDAPGQSCKHVLRDGAIVFTGNAGEVWTWLKSGGAK